MTGMYYLGKVRISIPSFVFTTVCSHWALRLPSRVTAVHPSLSVFVPGRPTLIMGSTVKTLPTSMNGQRSLLRKWSTVGSSWNPRPMP